MTRANQIANVSFISYQINNRAQRVHAIFYYLICILYETWWLMSPNFRAHRSRAFLICPGLLSPSPCCLYPVPSDPTKQSQSAASSTTRLHRRFSRFCRTPGACRSSAAGCISVLAWVASGALLAAVGEHISTCILARAFYHLLWIGSYPTLHSPPTNPWRLEVSIMLLCSF